jgi:alpha-beta hydrolase superfamily lysophospholipase
MPASVFATGSDGVRVALHEHRPVGAPRGVALVAHAMMASSSYQARFCERAAARGIWCWRMDFRGHGASKPPDPRTSDWGFDAFYARDLPAAMSAVASATGRAPDYVGHSLGGLAALAAFSSGAAPPPARLLLVAATPWVRRHGLTLGDRIARRAVAFAFRHASLPFGYAPVRLLRAGNEDEAQTYGRELAGWIEQHRWPWLERIGQISSETMYVYSPTDPYVRQLDAELVTSRLPRARTLLAPPGGHMSYFTKSGAWEAMIDFLS